MSGSADLIVRVLADTSNAQGNVNALIDTLGKMAGVGVGAGVAGGLVTASMQVQDSMARIQTSYNSADFSPGTAKFDAAQASIQKFSETTATSFSDAAAVYAQGARYIDDAGQRLDPSKLDEYTNTMLRLSKVSTDQLSPEDIGQQVDILSKLFGSSDFAQTGSEISALSGMHNQGEGPGLAAAISIGQVGADIGVSQEQALALGNYLADLGLGGGSGGSSIGRLLQRTNQGVDQLDPEQQYNDLKKQRDATEKVTDLQDQLRIAQEKQSQMYGQHGLKTQYMKDPAAVDEANTQIAKLQREINDAQQDQANTTTAKKSTGTSANIAAMAGLVGESPTDFAQSFQSDPISALLQWTTAVGQLPENQRASAMSAAFGTRGGSVNVRDQRIIEALANPDRQATLQNYLNTAADQAANPTDLTQRSQIPLSTTSSKVTDVSNAAYGTAAAAGNGPREAIDGLTSKVLDNTSELDKLNAFLGSNALAGDVATGAAAALAGVVPTIITSVLTSKAVTAAVGAGGGAASTAAGGAAASGGAAGVTGAVGAVAGGAATVAAVATPFVLADAYKTQHANDATTLVDPSGVAYAQRHPIGADVGDSSSPHPVNVGGVTVNVPGNATGLAALKQDVLNAVGQQLSAALDEAMAHSPLSGVLGGNHQYTGNGPRG